MKRATQILDWFIWCISSVFGLYIVLNFVVLLNHFDDDGGSRNFILVFSFFIGLTQIGFFVSPWAIKSENSAFKIFTAISSLPSILIIGALFLEIFNDLLRFESALSYRQFNILIAVILMGILTLYIVQLFRLLYTSNKSIKIFDS